MILSVRLNNFLIYSNEVELSLKADMRIKKFNSNVHSKNDFNVLKSLCVFGPNNSGKTCLVRGINSIKNILLGFGAEVPFNLYTNSKICSFGISFLEAGSAYSYDFKFDSAEDPNTKTRKAFVYECLKELFLDKYGNISEKVIFIRDIKNNIFKFLEDPSLDSVLSVVSSDNILIYTVNTNRCPAIEKYKNILRNFASKIEVLDMDNIPIDKTINILKNNEPIALQVVDIIKLSDLDIDDFIYNKKVINRGPVSAIKVNGCNNPREKLLNPHIILDDMFRLTSVHKGIPVQSISFDSTGTKKIIAVAGYIIDCLTKGKILIIDELDSSLHFRITRAIVSLFNNEINKNAQLIFTAHDVTLLDCKKLFRKDQIWFTAKDKENEYLYSLAEFTAFGNHVRSDSNIADLYSKGVFGAVPEPDLIEVLLNMKQNAGD